MLSEGGQEPSSYVGETMSFPFISGASGVVPFSPLRVYVPCFPPHINHEVSKTHQLLSLHKAVP